MVTAVRICFPPAPIGEWRSWPIGAQRWQAALTVCVCVAPQGMTSIASFAGHCKVVHVPDVLIDSGFETACARPECRAHSATRSHQRGEFANANAATACGGCTGRMCCVLERRGVSVCKQESVWGWLLININGVCVNWSEKCRMQIRAMMEPWGSVWAMASPALRAGGWCSVQCTSVSGALQTRPLPQLH